MLIVKIRNDGTGTTTIGHYDVSVFDDQTEIWRGRIEGHQRRLPWQHLVEQVLCAARGVPRGI
jgi:hypothetical protein